MNDYFKPWRRKFGVAVLVVGCVVMTGWVRSLQGVDTTAITIGNRSLVQIISREGTVAVRSIKSELPLKTIAVDRVLLMGFQAPQGNSTGNLAINVDATARAQEGSPFHWIVNRYGFEIGGVADKQFPLHVFIICAPHGAIVIPLMFLSAYLLLSKLRKTPSTNDEIPKRIP